MKYTPIILLAVVMTLLVGCKTTTPTLTYHSYPTESISNGLDGTQTLRVWASGRNRADAIEQAMKKAVYEVTFDGIHAGKGTEGYPVVVEANARKKYEQYFDLFFADGGDYRQYVSLANQNSSSIKVYKGQDNVTCSVVVRVKRSELRSRYTSDNIIVK